MRRLAIVGLAALAVAAVSCGRHGTQGSLIEWVNETVTVGAGNYTGWGYTYWVGTGAEIIGEFQTASGSIHLMVLDSDNWDEWKMQRPAVTEIDISGSSGDFRYSPTVSGMRHIALDNRQGASDVTVTLLVKYQEPDSP